MPRCRMRRARPRECAGAPAPSGRARARTDGQTCLLPRGRASGYGARSPPSPGPAASDREGCPSTIWAHPHPPAAAMTDATSLRGGNAGDGLTPAERFVQPTHKDGSNGTLFNTQEDAVAFVRKAKKGEKFN